MRPGLLDGVRMLLHVRHVWETRTPQHPEVHDIYSTYLSLLPDALKGRVTWTDQVCRVCDTPKKHSLKIRFPSGHVV